MARPAAISISSVTRVAPASSSPRKIPGKASTLLIWLGSSLRPVATIAAWRRATTGSISGSGFARAKTIASVRHHLEVLFADDIGTRDADEDVGTHHRVDQVAPALLAVGVLGEPATRLVERLVVLVEDAATIEPDDVADALGEQQLADRNAGRADAERRRRESSLICLFTTRSALSKAA